MSVGRQFVNVGVKNERKIENAGKGICLSYEKVEILIQNCTTGDDFISNMTQFHYSLNVFLYSFSIIKHFQNSIIILVIEVKMFETF